MDEQLLEMGMRLRELREVNGVSEEEMAEKLGKTVAEYLEYEDGKFSFEIRGVDYRKMKEMGVVFP